MAYIGKTPTIGNFQVCDAISVVNGQAAYTMQVGGVNVSPESANHMLVSLNGVIQKPTDAYTVSSSTITFASNLVTGDVIDFIQILGNVLDLGVPSDNTVSTAKIVDANVTTAKIADTSVTPAKLNLNDNLLFNTASKGIYLGVTSATASNLLDDYEEGTWTPAYSAGGGFSATYAKQIGNYTKIGNKVTCWITLFTNTVSLTSGANLTISGLPFASLSGDAQTDYSGTIGRNYRWSSDIDLHATVSQGNSSVTLYYQASNASNLLPAQTSQLTSGSNGYYNNIDITITYQTA